ncbi:MAG: T9SS type A sorting domain-containing protein [Bacteroidales bacterium]|nr:T9SS type A sorting domain-containing protein [Bacteroidales bacterium]
MNYGEKFDPDECGKYFLIADDNNQSVYGGGEAFVENYCLTDFRWNETFVLYCENLHVPIQNNTRTILAIDYHILPFERTITSDFEMVTDRVARREVTVGNQSTFTIGEGVGLDMYGTEAHDCKLIVESGSSLVIGDNALITAKRGDCEIVVNGNIQIGHNVTFKAENGATLKIKINGQREITVTDCLFANASLSLNASVRGLAFPRPIPSSATISRCRFEASAGLCNHALRIDGYSYVAIDNNIVNGLDEANSRHYEYGFLFHNCGEGGLGSLLLRNTIKGCTETGLTLYASTANVKQNEVTQCRIGVRLLNGSTVSEFTGNCGAISPSLTQHIHDNDECEVSVYRDCIPQTFRYNRITNSGNGWLFEYENNVEDGKGECFRIDLEHNNWGSLTNTQIESRFNYITNTNNSVSFDYLPKWSLGACPGSGTEMAIRKSREADSLLNIGLYSAAKTNYREIVTLYPNTVSAANALKKLLIAENLSEENYGELQQFYQNETAIQDNEILAALAGTFANKCDELQEHYDEAIAWYETIIEDEETPYNDSLFATIDLGNLYLKMEANGTKGTKGTLTQFIPKSAEAFAKQTDEALKKLKSAPRRTNPSRELPNQYWTDLVTEQPEGYVIDANGDVHLHSAEALAWLISTVNGLNGQAADDFDGKKVILEANVDMSAAIWVPIADGTNLGNPNPDRLRFCGVFDGNGFVVNGLILANNPFHYANFESFFGNLCGARIENVVLHHVYSEGRNERDGKFFGNAESLEKEANTRQTVIDRCYLEIDEMRKSGQDRESALFGYKNEGIITNCIVKLDKLSYSGTVPENEGLFVYHNYGAIQNCASVADSLEWLYIYGGMAVYNFGLIENCYSYVGDWFGWNSWWPPCPRMGVAYANYGTIRHCYYNTFKYHDDLGGGFFDEEPVHYGEGTIENTVPFEPTPYFQNPYWIFADTISVQSHTGFVYKTLCLEEALNDWILGQENSDDYEYWCADRYCSIFPNYLPSFVDVDITDIGENLTNNDIVEVYPNPTNGLVRVSGMNVAELRVCNILGQTVKTTRNTNEIDLKGTPQGIYLLRITDEKGATITRKIIVK